MKIEIVVTGDEVQVRRHNEDKSITVWVCENHQAALFKLASLITSSSEDPKEAKRSILVGDFVPAEKKKPARADIDTIIEKVKKALEKEGYQKKGAVEEELAKLPHGIINIPGITTPQISPWVEKSGTGTPNYPFGPYGNPTTTIPPYSLPMGGTVWCKADSAMKANSASYSHLNGDTTFVSIGSSDQASCCSVENGITTTFTIPPPEEEDGALV